MSPLLAAHNVGSAALALSSDHPELVSPYSHACFAEEERERITEKENTNKSLEVQLYFILILTSCVQFIQPSFTR